MASSGEVPGQSQDKAGPKDLTPGSEDLDPGSEDLDPGSEDLDQLKCQPCLEDGNLREAVGMCVDCQEYLCQQCYQVHTIPKPCRNHQLIDKEQMLQGQFRLNPKDVCTEKCSEHEDEVIKYYCTTHSLLGCTVCITLGHSTCQGVRYIPHVAKGLASNEEYLEVESKLQQALEAFKKVSERADANAEEIEKGCDDVIQKIEAYRRRVDEMLNKIQAALVEKALAMKSKVFRDLEAAGDKYKTAQDELQASLAKIEALKNANQNCSSYAEMMRTKEKLNTLEPQIQEAEVEMSCKPQKIQFYPSQETLDILNDLQSFGRVVFGPGTGSIIGAKHERDINVNNTNDRNTCYVKGLVVLPNGTLVLSDRNNNYIKAVNLQNAELTTQMKLPSAPWDIAAIDDNKVAVTMPEENWIQLVTVSNNKITADGELAVNGDCYGIDYRNGNIAVVFQRPCEKVQVLNLQGKVLYSISNSLDKQGNYLFKKPEYIAYGKDDTMLYVSNSTSRSVVCVKVDGTLQATYVDSKHRELRKPVVDSGGHVYVCAGQSVVQMTRGCKKIRELLTQPAEYKLLIHSICLSEDRGKLFVGMVNDNVMVYKLNRKSE